METSDYVHPESVIRSYKGLKWNSRGLTRYMILLALSTFMVVMYILIGLTSNDNATHGWLPRVISKYDTLRTLNTEARIRLLQYAQRVLGKDFPKQDRATTNTIRTLTSKNENRMDPATQEPSLIEFIGVKTYYIPQDDHNNIINHSDKYYYDSFLSAGGDKLEKNDQKSTEHLRINNQIKLDGKKYDISRNKKLREKYPDITTTLVNGKEPEVYTNVDHRQYNTENKRGDMLLEAMYKSFVEELDKITEMHNSIFNSFEEHLFDDDDVENEEGIAEPLI